MSSGERDLDRLLSMMRAERRPGEFVFVSLSDEQRLVAAWITLSVQSALDAVGLTAAVASRLTEAGISCNVLAGRSRDHLLVPVNRADEAVGLLGGPAE